MATTLTLLIIVWPWSYVLQVGDKYVLELMLERKATLGGEQSADGKAGNKQTPNSNTPVKSPERN